VFDIARPLRRASSVGDISVLDGRNALRMATTSLTTEGCLAVTPSSASAMGESPDAAAVHAFRGVLSRRTATTT
jgi:hypothetical protein